MTIRRRTDLVKVFSALLVGSVVLALAARTQAIDKAEKPTASAAAYAYTWEELLQMSVEQKLKLRAWLDEQESEPARALVIKAILWLLTPRQQCVMKAMLASGVDLCAPPKAALPYSHSWYLTHGLAVCLRPGQRFVVCVTGGDPKVTLTGGAVRRIQPVAPFLLPGVKPRRDMPPPIRHFFVFEAVRPGEASVAMRWVGRPLTYRTIWRHRTARALVLAPEDKPTYVNVFGPTDLYVGQQKAAGLDDLVTKLKAARAANQPVVIRPVDWMPGDEERRFVSTLSQRLTKEGFKGLSVKAAPQPLNPTAPLTPNWGPKSDNLRVELALDRREAHPGEQVTVLANLFNASNRTVVLPDKVHGGWGPGELCVTDPNGRRYALVSKLATFDARTAHARRPHWAARKLTFRLTDARGPWRSLDSNDAPPLSFRKTGKYTFTCRITANGGWSRQDKLPEWTGACRSNQAVLTVCELPPDKRRKTLTLSQHADLTTLGKTGDRAAADRLGSALLRAENEALALKAVQLLRQHAGGRPQQPIWWTRLFGLLQLRACQGGRTPVLGIDGPYLKPFAELMLDTWQRTLASPGWVSAHHPGALVAYLLAHPKDTHLRARTVALARKYAKVADLQPPRPGGNARDYRQAYRRLHFAWTLLPTLGVLRAGMSLEEAVKILGKPTRTRKTWVRWYFSSPMHVNPYLDATIKDGRVTGFRMGSA